MDRRYTVEELTPTEFNKAHITELAEKFIDSLVKRGNYEVSFESVLDLLRRCIAYYRRLVEQITSTAGDFSMGTYSDAKQMEYVSALRALDAYMYIVFWGMPGHVAGDMEGYLRNGQVDELMDPSWYNSVKGDTLNYKAAMESHSVQMRCKYLGITLPKYRTVEGDTKATTLCHKCGGTKAT